MGEAASDEAAILEGEAQIEADELERQHAIANPGAEPLGRNAALEKARENVKTRAADLERQVQTEASQLQTLRGLNRTDAVAQARANVAARVAAGTTTYGAIPPNAPAIAS
jgi:hypothetical protein